MTATTTAHVNAYLRAIRNAAKHDYANQYANFLRAQEPGGHPEFASEPDRPADLSYMAAQAVRMNLRDLFNRKG